jgi:PAS domain S-box-containing protein
MTVDVDAGKKAEDQPRHVAQLQATLNVIPAHTWYASPSGGLTFVNKRAADYLGLPKDHPLRFGIDVGAQWDAHLPFVHPDDREETQENWSTRLRTGEGGEGSFRIRNGQGGYRWFLSRAEPLRANDGTILQWVGVNLDIEKRKCAEQALRESERSARSALDGIAGLVAIMTPSGEVETVNRQCVEYFGRPLEEQKDWVTTDMVHPEDLHHMLEVFKKAIASEIPCRFEQRLRRFDGEYRWFDTRGGAVRDDTGSIVHWYVLLTDVEDRKRAEQALRRSEAYLEEAQRLSHCGVTAYKGSTVFYGSEEIYRIWGFDPAQGVPNRNAVLQRIHPDDRDRLNAEVERALSEKKRYSIAYRIVLPDGTVKHLESIGQPVFSTNGELVEVVATQIDVTERKRAEEGLRESEAKLRDYAETASDWFWEISPNYKFTLLTENAFGSNPADRIGTACWDHALDLETEPEKWRLLLATLDSRKPFRDFVYYSARGDGSPMYVKASGKPMFDASGEFRGYRGTGTDVTALRTVEADARENERRYREAQLELAHANRVATMGQLTSSIAHEVNQPITAAVTYALAARRFLSAKPPKFREVDDALSLIIKEGNRAGEVVGRVRALIKKAPHEKTP